MPKKSAKIKSFYEYFNDYSKEQINIILKNLSEKEKIEIKSLRRGECLTFVGDEHILIKINASDFEKKIIEEKNN